MVEDFGLPGRYCGLPYAYPDSAHGGDTARCKGSEIAPTKFPAINPAKLGVQNVQGDD